MTTASLPEQVLYPTPTTPWTDLDIRIRALELAVAAADGRAETGRAIVLVAAQFQAFIKGKS